MIRLDMAQIERVTWRGSTETVQVWRVSDGWAASGVYIPKRGLFYRGDITDGDAEKIIRQLVKAGGCEITMRKVDKDKFIQTNLEGDGD